MPSPYSTFGLNPYRVRPMGASAGMPGLGPLPAGSSPGIIPGAPGQGQTAGQRGWGNEYANGGSGTLPVNRNYGTRPTQMTPMMQIIAGGGARPGGVGAVPGATPVVPVPQRPTILPGGFPWPHGQAPGGNNNIWSGTAWPRGGSPRQIGTPELGIEPWQMKQPWDLSFMSPYMNQLNGQPDYYA